MAPWLFFPCHLQSWGFDCNFVSISIVPCMTLMYQASTYLRELFTPSKLASPGWYICCQLPSQMHIIVLWTKVSMGQSWRNTSQTMLPSLYWLILNQIWLFSLTWPVPIVPVKQRFQFSDSVQNINSHSKLHTGASQIMPLSLTLLLAFSSTLPQ